MGEALPADIETRRYDLVVIGAGINGAGIARDAAMRGLSVLLLDKGDLGGGTSSWSSRLIHGGLRYLEHGEIRLVRESLRERELLLRNASHLVKPIPMAIPLYEWNQRGPRVIRAGMIAYDALSFDKSLPRHRMWSRAKALQITPGLNPAGLLGEAVYYDAQATFAERLVVENVLSAVNHGAVVRTYARVVAIEREGERASGVVAADERTGETFRVAAGAIVNVAGPWVDRVLVGAEDEFRRLIGGTKGSHLVVDPFPGAPAQALHYEARDDHRAVLIIPWNGRYLIGSTDIRFEGDPDDVRTDEREIAYLLRETNAVIPAAGLTPAAVRYAYAGVRPLPYQPEGAEGSISRDHAVIRHGAPYRGLFSITGGKLTTYRALAEHAVNDVFRALGRRPPRSPTARIPLPGAAGIALEPYRAQFVAGSGLPEAAAGRLVDLYGRRAADVLAVAARDPYLREPFAPAVGAIRAEIVFAFEQEFAATLEDALLRRTMVGLEPDLGLGAVEDAAETARRCLGWSRAETDAAAERYRAHVRRFLPEAAEEPEGAPA